MVENAKPADKPEPAKAEPKDKVEVVEVEVSPGGTQDDLNPAFASPESQEKTAKDWTEGAEHTVDAEAADKEAKADLKAAEKEAKAAEKDAK